MKIFKFFFVVFLFVAGIDSAQAQFTLLPGTDKNYQECHALIAEYIRLGNKFSQNTSGNAPNFQTAEDNYNNALLEKDRAESAVQDTLQKMNQCIEKNGAGGTACSEEEYAYIDAKEDFDKANENFNSSTSNYEQAQASLGPEKNEVLACGIKTGRITLAMVPHYVTYIANFILGLIGLIAVLFTVIGGYYYVFGGLGEDKDKGKNTIKHAIMGMGLATLAWAIVNVIIQAITG